MNEINNELKTICNECNKGYLKNKCKYINSKAGESCKGYRPINSTLIYFIKASEIEEYQEILKEGSIYDLESLDFTEERKSLFEKEIFTYKNIEKVTAALEYMLWYNKVVTS